MNKLESVEISDQFKTEMEWIAEEMEVIRMRKNMGTIFQESDEDRFYLNCLVARKHKIVSEINRLKWLKERLKEKYENGTVNEVEREFNILANAWSEETWRNRTNARFYNANYIMVSRMGKEAVPFILERMRRTYEHWYHALEVITGENPVQAEDRGFANLMVKRWIEWGVAKGIILEIQGEFD